MRRLLAVFTAVTLSAVLTSCAGAAAPETESTESARPTASPTIEATPTPDASEVVAEIVVRANRIEVVALDGSLLESANLFTERELLVETLAEALGAAPTVTARPAGQETRAGQIHDWNGLSLFLANGEWDPLVADITRLDVTAASVNGVAIRTAAGFQVGTPISELDPATAGDQYSGGPWFRIDPETVGSTADLGPGGDPTSPLIASVVLYADATAVNRVVAPATNWGV
ncbi:MAG: hypothetical protein RL499_1127 [Actinomycetota bacterium]|jgi:hypothetical protein